MTSKPAITPTKLSKPAPELPEFEVRIVLSTIKRVRALSAEDAANTAWEEAMDNGEASFDVEELEDEDGAS